MNPSQIPFLDTWAEDFVAQRRASAQIYSPGGTSGALTLIAAVAARLERMAAVVEGWARGEADSTANPGQPASAR